MLTPALPLCCSTAVPSLNDRSLHLVCSLADAHHIPSPVLRFRAESWDTRTEHSRLQVCRADYHGSLLTVLRSRCASFVGVTGIVLLETRGTFQIITDKNAVKSECRGGKRCLDSSPRITCWKVRVIFGEIGERSCHIQLKMITQDRLTALHSTWNGTQP